MNENNLTPEEAYDFRGRYNYRWFKINHLENLKNCTETIEKEYKDLELGKGLSQDAIKRMLTLMDELIQFKPLLPSKNSDEDDEDYEEDTIDIIIKARNNFERDYLDKEIDKKSFFDMQEINLKVFQIYNYMSAVCEDE